MNPLPIPLESPDDRGMGQDTYLQLLGEDGMRIQSLWSKGNLGILWLACFRISDVVLDREGYIAEIRCDIETARRQFEGGVEVLRKTFPDTDFDIAESGRIHPVTRSIPGISEVRRLLTDTQAAHAKLETYLLFQDFSGNHIDRFLVHALLGFSQPQCKMVYDKGDFLRGLELPHGAPASGIMSWGDVLRAFAVWSLDTEFQPDGVPIRQATCLFTEAEYATRTWILAGRNLMAGSDLPAG